MIPFYYEDKNNNINIHYTVDAKPDPADFSMHAHKKCELYYYIDGNGYYSVEGSNYPLLHGTFILMREGEVHKIHIDPSMPYKRMAIHFSSDIVCQYGDNIHSLIYDRPLGKNNMFRFAVNDLSLSTADMIMRDLCAGGIPSELYEDYLQNSLKLVLTELCIARHRMSEKGISENVSVSSKDPVADDMTGRIILYINENLATIKGLSELETKFFFSRSYLNNLFKKSIGSTVWEYIIIKRLMTARELLKSGKAATIVAAECGFTDYSSFYRQYKSKFGHSPLEDRGIARDRSPSTK